MDELEKFIKEKFTEQARQLEEEMKKNPYTWLSEEDMKALELGRKILTESSDDSEQDK